MDVASRTLEIVFLSTYTAEMILRILATGKSWVRTEDGLRYMLRGSLP